MTIIIKAFISAYDSTVQDLGAKIHQKWPMRQRFFVGTIKPSKWLALTMSINISKSQNRRDITLRHSTKC